MIKIFFKALRLILMPFMLLWATLATPKGVTRPTDAQQEVDKECTRLKLYHFKTCPFCIKVRHEMARLSLPIELRDAQHDPKHRADLLAGGGKIQTPCLQITDGQGNVQWLYESKEIIGYLQQRFSPTI
ncbi:MAG: glutathione S-transferase N-terminal domain-containing protein [Proteobacteria bacterium]|nr:glutathione S-transferase N-terminal domain-containing protein [Pseudomonadota bacterium]